MFLIVAPEGMLGTAFEKVLAERQLVFRKAGLPELDITNAESVAAHMHDVKVVLNCAAWTDVDGAEEREEDATQVNGEGARVLAIACRERGALLVHPSTDYVFAGNASAPYPVDAPRNPINAYGRSKAVGEVAIEESGARHLILRTSWLYAPWGHNFVRTMVRLGKEKESLRVVNDQRGRPTSAEHFARATIALLDAKAEGTLHLTDGGECTWFELAAHVVSRVSQTCVVEPCSSDEYPRPAARPAYSVLDLAPTEALIGELAPWKDNVDAVLAQLEST